METNIGQSALVCNFISNTGSGTMKLTKTEPLLIVLHFTYDWTEKNRDFFTSLSLF